ncbi:hypothetical protein PFY12_03140 [Chryseobacterium camelliae]|uniref:Uncharacterized protein n=1 Tax=Chryseobacterium camelliae TaxID=1265445 RepID=A0ABY7QQ73_9FLAO|nr:hypothetical protein [Chryseobacterium camelliae]WBV61122.1 hypothetical protein PFY12_03140 [Chryseobacterium camelliae]
MKKALILSFILLLGMKTFAQESEFKVYKNGLIYSEKAMDKLSHIADSLNLKFKTCDLSKKFYSKSQTNAYIVKMEGGNIKAAMQDMKNQMPAEEFIKKYPDASITKNALVIKRKYKDYNDKDVVEFEEFNLKDDYGFSITSENVNLYDQNLQHQWLFEHDKETSYSKESLEAFYFPNRFSSGEIPEKYAYMIGYSDCLIDTTATKFKDKVKEGRVDMPKNWMAFSDKRKAKLLEELRGTRVIGGCSQDMGPRVHAVNIALLSAETYNWNVFLKSHLDIMNDRFDRVTDGSYAWGQRNTYIRELEELNIDVLKLVMGISFRIENPVKNHYYGSIGRIGRALSESQNKTEAENTLLTAIADNNLDHYNRLLLFFLFKNYNSYTADETLKKTNEEKLFASINGLPDYYIQQLK